MEWNHFYSGNENSTAIYNAADMCWQLCHLLQHRSGTWFISIAISNMVRNFIMTAFPMCGAQNSVKCFLPLFALLPNRIPFEWKNPIGYLFAIFFEYILFGFAYYLIACSFTLVIGAHWFAISVTKEIQGILHSIKDKTRAKSNQSNELNVLFAEFIDTHGAIKQLSKLPCNDQFTFMKRTHCKFDDIWIFSEWNMIFRTFYNPCSPQFSLGVFWQFPLGC